MQGNKLKNCTLFDQKSWVFFEDYYGVADVKFIEMVKKNFVLFDKEDFENHCAVISIQNYIEIYFESCETCCAPLKKEKSQLFVYSHK